MQSSAKWNVYCFVYFTFESSKMEPTTTTTTTTVAATVATASTSAPPHKSATSRSHPYANLKQAHLDYLNHTASQESIPPYIHVPYKRGGSYHNSDIAKKQQRQQPTSTVTSESGARARADPIALPAAARAVASAEAPTAVAAPPPPRLTFNFYAKNFPEKNLLAVAFSRDLPEWLMDYLEAMKRLLNENYGELV